MVAGVNRFEMRNLTDFQAVDELVADSRGWGSGDVTLLDFARVRTVWPNVAVAVAATLDYLRDDGHKLVVDHVHPNQARTHLIAPLTIDKFVRWETPLTNNVWRYRSEDEAQALSTKFMEALTEQVACEAGVIDALNWCIYEVLDNVFQHSHATSGYVMMQLHSKQRKCVIAVTDTGRGIHKSLAESPVEGRVDRSKLSEAHLAIGHALEQGVTSKGKLNQGNGLHGLRRAVEINGGELTVRSGRGQWTYKNGKVSAFTDYARPVLDVNSSHSTTVDWRLNCATPVSINEALGRAEQPSALLGSIEVGDRYYRIDAAELEEYVGSRAKGLEVRTRIHNYLAAGAQQVVLDLSSIGVVSSSFADEVVGKLAVQLGELEYRRRVFIENASPTNRGLIERAIELRLESGL
jgi:anti-sigma regulatory factor (Ser/Thr protein kinase)